MSYPNSYYAATVETFLDQPQLDGEVHSDVCVIGGGFTGLSTAFHLAKQGYKVTLLEAEKIGWGASGRNGGQLGVGQVHQHRELINLCGSDQARMLWEMADEARILVKHLIRDNGIECDFRNGNLGCAVTRGDFDDFKTNAEFVAQHYGYQNYQVLQQSEITETVGYAGYYGGLLDMSAGHLHPLKYAQGLARAAIKAGVTIFENSCVQAIQNGGKVTVVTNKGSLIADFVVLGCNGYLGRLAPGIASEVLPADNYQIATVPLDEEVAHSILTNNTAAWDTSKQVYYYRKTPDKRLIFGGGVGYPGLEPEDIAKIVRPHLCNIYPALADVQIDYAWSGTFAATRNQLPCFGRLAPNVLYAHGYTGHGVGLATIAGQIMADCVSGTAERFDFMSSLPKRRYPGAGRFNSSVLSLGFLYIWLMDKFRS
jgi:gamma-glutamylputrescine oxidase